MKKNKKDRTFQPICLNSKGGRGGVENLQPSLQDRIYSGEGIMVALTTHFQPYILERNFKEG